MIAIPYIVLATPVLFVLMCWTLKGISWILYYLEEH